MIEDVLRRCNEKKGCSEGEHFRILATILTRIVHTLFSYILVFEKSWGCHRCWCVLLSSYSWKYVGLVLLLPGTLVQSWDFESWRLIVAEIFEGSYGRNRNQIWKTWSERRNIERYLSFCLDFQYYQIRLDWLGPKQSERIWWYQRHVYSNRRALLPALERLCWIYDLIL